MKKTWEATIYSFDEEMNVDEMGIEIKSETYNTFEEADNQAKMWLKSLTLEEKKLRDIVVTSFELNDEGHREYGDDQIFIWDCRNARED